MKAALSSLLVAAGKAGLALAGPFRAFSAARDERGDYVVTAPPAGFGEWRISAGAAHVQLYCAGKFAARAPVRGGVATGFLHAQGAPLTIALYGETAPYIAPSFAWRPLNRRALIAHTLALRANRLSIFKRWSRHGFGGAAEALLAASRGANVDDYDAWITAHETPQQAPEAIRAWLSALRSPPLISVVTPVYQSQTAWLRACLASVHAQIYPHWEHCLVDDCSPNPEAFGVLEQAASAEPRVRTTRRSENGGIAAATNDAIAMTRGAWIAFLDHDDTLSPDALALAADAIDKHPEARIIYTDEDKIDEHGARSEPFMKGGWNPSLFAVQNYLNHLTLIRRDLIEQAGGLRSAFDGSQDYDLLLRCIALVPPSQIVHVPAVAYHWRFARNAANFSVQQAEKTQARLCASYAANKTPGALERAADGLPYPRLRPAMPSPAPLVSLIIPTRDGAALLRQCISTLTAKAGWPNFEIIVMDNDSTAPDALALFDEYQRNNIARIIRYPGPFNFSAINNQGARHARGEILGFINNDIETLSADWLAEMARWFSEPDIAGVGAKLLYPDGRIQHAGLVTGIGGSAGHLFKYRESADPGQLGQLARARDVSALTAACLLVRAEAFKAIGGFDETAFPVAFNDVDLCLRLRAAGHRLIWTPDAVLTHHESASRGSDDANAAKRARFEAERNALRARWGAALEDDPYYSPNLTLTDESGALAWPPRCRRPWAS